MRVRDHERHNAILVLLRERGELGCATIARRFNVSMATARRDLTILANEGKLLRTFGGAKIREEPSLVMRTFSEKIKHMGAAKVAMAKAAARLAAPGMTLFLDTGTTIWELSKQLKHISPLTVVTASLAIIEEIGAASGIRLFAVGGEFRAANLDFVGPQVQAALAQFHADIAFVGIDKLIPERGGYTADRESAALIQAMARSADRRVILADHTKIDADGFILALASERIDVLITDGGISGACRRKLATGPYRLIVAK